MSNKTLLLFYLSVLCQTLFSQTKAVWSGDSKAIHKDSAVFVSWASGITVERGYINISDTNLTFTQAGITSNKVWAGQDSYALGKADGNTVSLGDAGFAILTFEKPVRNGEGPDFAVFENSFFSPQNQDTMVFAELAFVEVSSDGVNFFRFPSISRLQYETQINGNVGMDMTSVDYRLFENFAGQYVLNWGTPFDLNDIEDNELLDKQNITHIKIIDVVGSINLEFASYDSYGNIVNDPFPTPFWTGGFDLDAVGVIHQKQLSINQEYNDNISVFPNPASEYVTISFGDDGGLARSIPTEIRIIDLLGNIIETYNCESQQKKINISNLKLGIYIVQIINTNEQKIFNKKFVKN